MVWIVAFFRLFQHILQNLFLSAFHTVSLVRPESPFLVLSPQNPLLVSASEFTAVLFGPAIVPFPATVDSYAESFCYSMSIDLCTYLLFDGDSLLLQNNCSIWWHSLQDFLDLNVQHVCQLVGQWILQFHQLSFCMIL